MGIYYYAVDWENKEYFTAPGSHAIKEPGIFAPGNPFPAMVVMENIREGAQFEIISDMDYRHERMCEFVDVTEVVWKKYLSLYPCADPPDHIFEIHYSGDKLFVTGHVTPFQIKQIFEFGRSLNFDRMRQHTYQESLAMPELCLVLEGCR